MVVVIYGGGVIGVGKEECDERENDDEATEAGADAVEDEGCVQEDVDGGDAVG